MKSAICSVQGCGLPVKQNGWCNKHYQRWYAHGDPLKTKTAPTGEPLKYLKMHRNHDSDECVIWPYGKNELGYGLVQYQGKRRKAHQLMCEWTRGPKPEGQGALHSCGNGHFGCINPRHISWGSQKQNMQDAEAHGTIAREMRLPHTVLTDDDVRYIKSMQYKIKAQELADRFGVLRPHIYAIQNGRRRRSVK
jgi:hypothetical protein